MIHSTLPLNIGNNRLIQLTLKRRAVYCPAFDQKASPYLTGELLWDIRHVCVCFQLHNRYVVASHEVEHQQSTSSALKKK